MISAQFSPDGQRVVTASLDKTARVWDALAATDTIETILLLAKLAEANAGAAFVSSGQTESLSLLDAVDIRATRQDIAEKFTTATRPTPIGSFLKWRVADWKTRTISPLSKLTVPEWIEDCIEGGPLLDLRDAMNIEPENPRLMAHLGRRLADYAIDTDTDPDEARRARGEANFLIRRALKFEPDNAEIQKLRAEMEEVLSH